MGRKVDVEDLVGTGEIAQRLGFERIQIVHDWASRHADFPKPITRLGNTHVWAWPDVEAWAKRTGRL